MASPPKFEYMLTKGMPSFKGRTEDPTRAMFEGDDCMYKKAFVQKAFGYSDIVNVTFEAMPGTEERVKTLSVGRGSPLPRSGITDNVSDIIENLGPDFVGDDTTTKAVVELRNRQYITFTKNSPTSIIATYGDSVTWLRKDGEDIRLTRK